MADPPYKSMARGGLSNTTGNDGGVPRQRQPHQPSPEGSIDNNHTPTSTATKILTPGSSVDSPKSTDVSASEETGGVVDRPVESDGQTIDFRPAGVVLPDISAPESSEHSLLVDNDTPNLELDIGPDLIHASRPGSMSFGSEVGSPCNAFLSLSDGEQDGGHKDYHGRVLMDSYLDNVPQNLPYRLLDQTNVNTISREQERADIMAGNTAASELEAVSLPSIYPLMIEETLEELL